MNNGIYYWKVNTPKRNPYKPQKQKKGLGNTTLTKRSG